MHACRKDTLHQGPEQGLGGRLLLDRQRPLAGLVAGEADVGLEDHQDGRRHGEGGRRIESFGRRSRGQRDDRLARRGVLGQQPQGQPGDVPLGRRLGRRRDGQRLGQRPAQVRRRLQGRRHAAAVEGVGESRQDAPGRRVVQRGEDVAPIVHGGRSDPSAGCPGVASGSRRGRAWLGSGNGPRPASSHIALSFAWSAGEADL